MSIRKRPAQQPTLVRTLTLPRGEATRQVKEAVARFRAGKPHIALRNHDHPIDREGDAVLSRLGALGRASDRITAAEAIAAALPPEAWDGLFADCIIAEWRARQHAKWIKESQGIIDRAAKAKAALAVIRSFLNRPSHASPGEHDSIDEALSLVARDISMKKRLADDHLKIVSRKTTADAARAEGIAFIRESLQQACNRTGGIGEPRYVAAIATAALNMGEITTDAVRKTVSFTDRVLAAPYRP